MTISSTNNSTVAFGNGAMTVFQFAFVADSTAFVQVIYTNTLGAQTTLNQSQYSITLNPIAPGALWSVGGSITYPLIGSPIAAGTSLTISRILPLTQQTDISDQGDFAPDVIEQALDVLCMEIQQVAGRTGQLRGTWVSGVAYNFGDVVQDGVNGSNSGNYYMCVMANTSGTWTVDLANGDWSLIIQASLPSTPLPLAVANGGTGASTPGAALNNLGGISLTGNNAFTGNNTHAGTETFTGGSIAVPTAGAGDSSTKAASTAFVNGTALTLAAGTTATTQSASDNSTKVATTAFVQGSIGATNGGSVVLLGTQTASNSPNVVFTGIPSGYDQYELRLTNVTPATNNVNLLLQFSTNNGSSFVASNYTWAASVTSTTGGSSPGTNINPDSTEFSLSGTSPINNTANIGLSGKATFVSLGSSTGVPLIYWQVQYLQAGGGDYNITGGGRQGVAGPYNALLLLMSSGNIASGKFSLYGIRSQ